MKSDKTFVSMLGYLLEDSTCIIADIQSSVT